MTEEVSRPVQLPHRLLTKREVGEADCRSPKLEQEDSLAHP